jgi:RND family efflux transporter MFP subunit
LKEELINMKKSLVILVLITLLALLSAGCTSGESDLVETVEVIRGDLTETVPISGNLEMPDRVNLSFGMTGEVVDVLVGKGDTVATGDVLAKLDTAEIDARLKIAQLGIKAIQIDYEIARNRLMETLYPRYTGTFLSDLAGTWVALEEMDETLAEAQRLIDEWDAEGLGVQLDEAESILAKAKDKLHKGRWPMPFFVKTIEMELDKAALAIDIASAEIVAIGVSLPNAVITAPVGGEILWIDLEPGEWAVATAPVITIIDTSVLQMKGIVDEMDMPFVELGGKVVVTLDALPEKQTEGKVTYISPVGTIQSGVVFYETTLELEKIDSMFRDGMSATADVIVEERKDVLLLPVGAISREGGGYYVMKMLGEEQSEQIEIKVGLNDGRFVEILSGLKEGDEVLIRD